jgi:hypothetical protein
VHQFWVASHCSLVVASYPPCPFPRCAPHHHYRRSTRNPPHKQLLVGLEAGGALLSVVCHSFVVVCHHSFIVICHRSFIIACHRHSFVVICHHSFVIVHRLSYIVHLFIIIRHLLYVVCSLSSIICRTSFIRHHSSLLIGVCRPYLSALRAVAHSSRG